MDGAAETDIVEAALLRIQQLSAAVWEVRAHHEPVATGRWPRRRTVCRSCGVAHPCPTWRALSTRRVCGCGRGATSGSERAATR